MFKGLDYSRLGFKACVAAFKNVGKICKAPILMDFHGVIGYLSLQSLVLLFIDDS